MFISIIKKTKNSDTNATGNVQKPRGQNKSVVSEDACLCEQIESSNYLILSRTYLALQLLKFEFGYAITTVETASLRHDFTISLAQSRTDCFIT
jgi:hypothetical protein